VAADGIERLARQPRRRTHARAGFGAIVARVPLLLAAGAVTVAGRVLQPRHR
jgi:hypothetical protein